MLIRPEGVVPMRGEGVIMVEVLVGGGIGRTVEGWPGSGGA